MRRNSQSEAENVDQNEEEHERNTNFQPSTAIAHLICSSGSRNFKEGGPRNMKYKSPCTAAIFFVWPIFYRPGGAWPPCPSLDPLLDMKSDVLKKLDKHRFKLYLTIELIS